MILKSVQDSQYVMWSTKLIKCLLPPSYKTNVLFFEAYLVYHMNMTTHNITSQVALVIQIFTMSESSMAVIIFKKQKGQRLTAHKTIKTWMFLAKLIIKPTAEGFAISLSKYCKKHFKFFECAQFRAIS